MISETLVRAAKRGVNVYLVLEQASRKKDLSTKVNTKSAKYFKKHNIHIRFDSKKTKLHSKAIVIDDIVYIGSHNFTRSAMEFNHEASIRIESADLAKDVIQYIENIK